MTPHLKRFEPNGCAIWESAGIDEAINVADGIQTDLDRVFDREIDLTNAEPVQKTSK